VSASNGLGRYIVYALDKQMGWKTTDKKGAVFRGRYEIKCMGNSTMNFQSSFLVHL
jgi:hypothetical protein